MGQKPLDLLYEILFRLKNQSIRYSQNSITPLPKKLIFLSIFLQPLCVVVTCPIQLDH
jgi:hypothetical protein